VAERRRRPLILGLLMILVLAGIWRAVLALRLPVIARDGVTFCRHARLLGEYGLAYLRDPNFQQHPLFPLAILGVQRLARSYGAPDTPLTWQYSGQIICWSAGLVVILLTAALTARLTRRLELPVAPGRALLIAALLAAVTDLNVWLSADVMSDQVHLAFYLGAVLLLLQLQRWWTALAVGLLSGLAFLTREEGFVPAAASLVALLAARRTLPRPTLFKSATALLVGFAVLAGPYWAATGKFSPKKNPLHWLDTAVHLRNGPAPEYVSVREFGRQPIAEARLETLDLPWYAVLPEVLYKLLRAGRVVIPLLALLPLVSLRNRLTHYPLVGWTCSLVGHLALATLLLTFHGYLSPRHLLVPVALLTPLAALLLTRLYQLLADLHHEGWARLAVAATLLPLLPYALRVPNSGDAYLRDAANWLQTHDAQHAEKRLLSGSGPQRLAFYANMRWEYWPEQPAEYDALVRQIRDDGAGYFAIEVGPGFERAGNRELVARLRADAALAQYLGHFHERPGPSPDVTLFLIELKDVPGDQK